MNMIAICLCNYRIILLQRLSWYRRLIFTFALFNHIFYLVTITLLTNYAQLHIFSVLYVEGLVEL